MTISFGTASHFANCMLRALVISKEGILIDGR